MYIHTGMVSSKHATSSIIKYDKYRSSIYIESNFEFWTDQIKNDYLNVRTFDISF